MTSDTRIVDPLILSLAHEILKDIFGSSITIGSASWLSEAGRRNSLIRITIGSTILAVKTVIIKQYLKEAWELDDQKALDRFVKDYAALSYLNSLETDEKIVPQFYGGNEKLRFVLIEDLGDIHVSLVDALLSTDRNAAQLALGRYVRTIGRLHGLAHQHMDRYKAVLDRVNKNVLPWQNDHDEMIAELEPILRKLNMPINGDERREIKEVFKTIRAPHPLTTLIHSDICPDNVFDDPKNDQMRIIDFEWSNASNALLDGVYLRMSMPTCWCTKAFPKDIIDEYEGLYRRELIKYIPAAKSDKIYNESYVAACAFWMIWNIVSIKEIWDKDSDLSNPLNLAFHPQWRLEDCLKRPRVLYRIQAFVDVAKNLAALPHLHDLACKLLDNLKLHWPNTNKHMFYSAFEQH